MLKNVEKNYDFFYQSEYFLCKFLNLFSNFTFIFNLLFW